VQFRRGGRGRGSPGRCLGRLPWRLDCYRGVPGVLSTRMAPYPSECYENNCDFAVISLCSFLFPAQVRGVAAGGELAWNMTLE